MPSRACFASALSSLVAVAGCAASSSPPPPSPAPAPSSLASASAPRWATSAAAASSSAVGAAASASVAPPLAPTVLRSAEGDEVRVGGESVEITTSLFDGAPLTLRFPGRVQFDPDDADDRRAFVTSRESKVEGPLSFEVRRGDKTVTLERAGRAPHALDLDSLAAVEGLSFSLPPRRKGDTLDLGDVEIADFDFDGHPDLAVKVGLAHKCAVVQYFLFDAAKAAFREVPEMRGLSCVSRNPKKKELVSTSWTCCERFFSVFRWKDGALVHDRDMVITLGEHPRTGKPLPAGTVYFIKSRGKKVIAEGVSRSDGPEP